MRTWRTTIAAAWCLAIPVAMAMAAGVATTSDAATPEVKDFLKFQPTLEGVEYDRPGDAASIAACKVEEIPGGFVLKDGQGKILLRFLDRDRNGKLDQWSYFQDGFEVYRELDNNGDQSLDEVRFFNSGGTRSAKMAGKKVAGWTRISAEEASKVLVQAIVRGDSALLETVMASPAELDALGVPRGEVDQVAAAEKQRIAQIRAMRATLMKAGWDDSTIWLRLDGAMPHLIPADAGLKEDLLLYENAVIFAGSTANNQANSGRMAFLQVGEIVKVGETWKFVDLPRAVDPSKNANGVIAAVDGGIRSWVYRNDGNAAPGADNPEVAAALQALAAYDKAHGNLLTGAAPKDIARYHYGRIAPLNGVAKAAEAAGDAKTALDHYKLSVDSLAAAYATGEYPAGSKALDGLAAKGGKVGTYAAFKLIEAEFALQNATGSSTNSRKVEKDWLASLKAFADKYPQSEEAPQALLFMASTHDMNGDEDDARKDYAVLARDYPATEWGKKAAGALRRLDLVGKPLALKGLDLRGQTIDAAGAAYRGKTLLVTFWATWAAPAKVDLIPDLVKLQAKYKARGFEVLAVNLDTDRAELDAFLKANPLPWPEIFEPGGMESRLATEFGVISLPTMILVDADGKVLNRSLRTAGELEILLEKALPPKAGVALGRQ